MSMEKRRLNRIAAALCALACLLLCGCTQKPADKSFLAMDTVMTVTAYGKGAQAAVESCRSEVLRLEGLFSATDGQSEVFAANSAGSAQLSAETEELLRLSLELCALTDGALDITLRPIMRAWGFTDGNYRVPDAFELEQLLENTGCERVSLENGSVFLPAGTELDLGATAKGFTADRLAGLLRDAGVESALLDLGHNIQLVGTKPDGSDWRIAVQDPFGAGYAGTLSVSDCAVVTSGGYERYFTDGDGRTYCHIMDPETGAPADSGLASVTIIGDSGLLCDGLSTAVFVMGAPRALELWRSRTDFEMVLIAQDGEIILTAGAAEIFTAADENARITVAER